MHLDYTLKTPEERIAYVNNILENTPKEEIKNAYYNYMSDYILFVADKNQTKQEQKENHPIATKNREITIKKREISYEEMVSNLENGEDGIYALITNDKNQIMDPKERISAEEKKNPEIAKYMNLIDSLQKQFENATGKTKFNLKRQIIETWQQVYILRKSLKGIPARGRVSNQVRAMVHMNLEENITIGEDGMPHSDAFLSLLNPTHVSFLLCHYTQLKQECVDDLTSDMYFLLLDLENLTEKALAEKHPILYDLLIWKIDGLTNEEIRKQMEATYGVNHNDQYFSTLWRKRIPKLIAEQAQKDYLIWYYTNVEYGHWKKCGRCGEIKLAHPLFFARNTTQDGYYSICKECRRQK